MEREANYLAVGSFVVLLAVMTVLFVYWYSAANDHSHFKHYEIYFDGSVSGLTAGSPVRYLGVDVGRVQSLRIDPRSANRVQVIADIDPNAPISERTVAHLSLQGVTGLLYIDLQQQPAGAPGRQVLADVPSQQYPVIPSVHSDFDLFLSSLPDLTARLDELVDRASRLLSDQNIQAVEHITGHLDQATAALPGSARDLDRLLSQLSGTVQDADRVIGDLHTATDSAGANFTAAAAELRTASDTLARTSARLDAFVADNRGALTDLVQEGVPQLEGLLRDSRTAVQQINALARSLHDNPSRLLYQPRAAGVSIPP